ncbi:MAG: hypothetical protein K0S56_4721 [Microvirga sp.]|nr:hypothetical protein [Microvirga sp.]
MSTLMTSGLPALTAVCIIASAVGTASAEPLPKMTPLVGEVLTAPRPVKGSDGRTHLVYELHLSNETHLDLGRSLDKTAGRAGERCRRRKAVSRRAPRQ